MSPAGGALAVGFLTGAYFSTVQVYRRETPFAPAGVGNTETPAVESLPQGPPPAGTMWNHALTASGANHAKMESGMASRNTPAVRSAMLQM
jgi:hypothetical protein